MAVKKAKTATKTSVKSKAKTKEVANKKTSVNVKVKKVASKTTVMKDKQTRIEILQTIAEKSNLTKTQVETVFDTLVKTMEGHLKKKGSGEFTIPKTGIKIKRVKKKATKARTMLSPLTNTEVTIAGKPARFAVKLTALKALKDMVEA